VVEDATDDGRRPIGGWAAPRVARAIDAVLEDPSYRRRARSIAAEMAAAPTAEDVLGLLSP
jgi:UDP:flavonoid glycosyltransferase YjiC (YdhE family)